VETAREQAMIQLMTAEHPDQLPLVRKCRLRVPESDPPEYSQGFFAGIMAPNDDNPRHSYIDLAEFWSAVDGVWKVVGKRMTLAVCEDDNWKYMESFCIESGIPLWN
jgi:hypothetical protein